MRKSVLLTVFSAALSRPSPPRLVPPLTGLRPVGNRNSRSLQVFVALTAPNVAQTNRQQLHRVSRLLLADLREMVQRVRRLSL